MSRPTSPDHWKRKFRLAVRGLRVGARGQSSFAVHGLASVVVLAAAVVLRVNLLEWCVLLLCIGMVLAAELFNSALESCARAITEDYREEIRNSLDIASAGVLIAALFAAIVGTTIFVFRLGMMMGWWASYLVY